MNLKDLIADGVIIGMSLALLWYFSNMWRYGQHLIQEPDIVILSLETAGLLLILAFGVSKYISDLKNLKERDSNAGLLRVRESWDKEDI